MGVGLAPVFAVYTGASITRVFFITAATFASASILDIQLKEILQDLDILFMGLIGLIIAMVVNIFPSKFPLQFTQASRCIHIYRTYCPDTQNAKKIYLTHGGDPIWYTVCY